MPQIRAFSGQNHLLASRLCRVDLRHHLVDQRLRLAHRFCAACLRECVARGKCLGHATRGVLLRLLLGDDEQKRWQVRVGDRLVRIQCGNRYVGCKRRRAARRRVGSSVIGASVRT